MNMHRPLISFIAAFAFVALEHCGDATVAVADAGGERSDNRCGPTYGNARCGTNRCCSTANFCGGLTETHCTTTRGYNGMFDGPRM